MKKLNKAIVILIALFIAGFTTKPAFAVFGLRDRLWSIVQPRSFGAERDVIAMHCDDLISERSRRPDRSRGKTAA